MKKKPKDKPEKISDELLAQMKFIHHHLQEAEQALIERRGAKVLFERYLVGAYNLQDGDGINEAGEIVRKEPVLATLPQP